MVTMKNSFLVSMLAVLLLSCVPSTQKNLEEARFHLDKGEFSEAIALVQPILDEDPDNNEAKFIYASALIGSYALEPKSGCDESDTGYLGLLACLLDDKEADDPNGLKTFARISPDDATQDDDILEAVDVLQSIDAFDSKTPEKDVALQRMVGRAFFLSTILREAGASSPNEDCNAGGAGVDNVPDDFDSTNINATEATAFRENLEGIQSDANIVGFGDDFNLITRATDILNDIEDQGGSTLFAVRAVFENTFNSPDQQVCN